MIAYFIISTSMTAMICYYTHRFFQQWVDKDQLLVDDAKGYFLISAIFIGFTASAISFYVGQTLGYGEQEATSTAMGLAILLDVMAALLTLIWGLAHFREPEQY